VLEELGWTVITAWTKESFGTEGLLWRAKKSEVILFRYLLEALQKLNPGIPQIAYDSAWSK
jgi:type I restriction enzyme, R subunit